MNQYRQRDRWTFIGKGRQYRRNQDRRKRDLKYFKYFHIFQRIKLNFLEKEFVMVVCERIKKTKNLNYELQELTILIQASLLDNA